MRIVIDLQGAQTNGSRNRGIGRYSLALAKAIAINNAGHEILIVLNGAYKNTIEPICKEFDGLIKRSHVKIWFPSKVASYLADENAGDVIASEMIREAFIQTLSPDFVLITSIFEGLDEPAVISVHEYDRITPVAVIQYDLIPLIHQSHYLKNAAVERWYRKKLDYARKADLQLAISESSRQESIEYLETEPRQIVNISTAADSQFQPVEIDLEEEKILRRRYGLNRDYVMFTGGVDFRKNIEGLIRAYAKLSPELKRRHQLAIVCSVQDHDRRRLTELAETEGLSGDELILTGFVPEDDLVKLYNLCKVFVFPSWHEGFGLPALEAMACGKAVIGANRSSVPEVLGCAAALFDPHSVSSIAQKLQQTLTDGDFRERLEVHAIEQARRFSWARSAQSAIQAMELYKQENTAGAVSEVEAPVGRVRPRLAYVSPLPPERSGIADYSAELLPALAKHYDIEVVIAQAEVITPWVLENCKIRNVEWFLENKYDRVIYQIGNSEYHEYMFDLIKRIPGVVVLHDFYLSGIYSYMESTGKSKSIWSENLYHSHGYAALKRRLKSSETTSVIWKYPCNFSVLQDALGIVIHSDHSKKLARKWYGPQVGSDWNTIPLLRTPAETSQEYKNQARKILEISEDILLVCAFGFLGKTKLNDRLLKAWMASSFGGADDCKLVFVGERDRGPYGDAIDQILRQDPAARNVTITGWTDEATYKAYLFAADIGVQLRTLSRGETSAAVLDCMNYGLATIVNSNGSMSDLPDDTVLKLPDEFSDEELIEALESVKRNHDFRQEIGRRSQLHIWDKHSPDQCAQKYFDAIEAAYAIESDALPQLMNAIATRGSKRTMEVIEIKNVAKAIDLTFEQREHQAQVLVDVTGDHFAASTDESTFWTLLGDQWLGNVPGKSRVEPIFWDPTARLFRYARSHTLDKLSCEAPFMTDDPVEFRSGDIYLGSRHRSVLESEATDVKGTFESLGVRAIEIRPEIKAEALAEFFRMQEPLQSEG